MLAGYARPDDGTRRTDQERELRVPPGSPSVREREGLRSGPRVLLTLFLCGAVLGVLTSASSAADRSDGANDSQHFWPVSATRTAGGHAAREIRPLIEMVRFNGRAVSFERGVNAGPAPGTLEIQFATPASGAPDRLHYRLVGFDTEWHEAGPEREVVYDRLEPGRYEFDVEPEERRGAGNWVAERIPITVVAPYWQTGWFRSACMLFLLLVILALHRLRVGTLVRHTRRLEEAVNQTRAELTLAVKMAGDAQEALKEQALKDSLTGLWNRGAILAMLEREVYRAQRDGFPITLVMIDLDHFKNINDTYGHPTGDEVLREAASRLFEVMRPYDFAGRYGGEEFLVVLPSCSPHNGVRRAEDFRRVIAEKPVPTALGPLAVTCSLGVAVHHDGVTAPDDLIRQADEALYRAKRLGRNCVCAGSEGKAGRKPPSRSKGTDDKPRPSVPMTGD